MELDEIISGFGVGVGVSDGAGSGTVRFDAIFVTFDFEISTPLLRWNNSYI